MVDFLGVLQIPLNRAFQTGADRMYARRTTASAAGKFDESRKLSNGGLMEFAHIYPMDAVFDTPEDVPEDVKANKRYAGADGACADGIRHMHICIAIADGLHDFHGAGLF